ncbi:KilA-N domain-containing protein [Candidatus Saccharibacteria bacterium]|nr:KilA-N domain-containing protein [Candidatus Saccharibacteria bacterium]
MPTKTITTIKVNQNNIGVMRIGQVDYISLTDLAKYANTEKPSDVIVHWLSNKTTFNFLGLWEKINNPNFNFAEYRAIKTNEVGCNAFTLSPRRWIASTNASGIISRGGRYSIGTFAHPDIAFEFASWLSPEFKLYLIREFERLKKNEQYHEKLEWHANRLLAKANYLIQTDAIKENIIPTITEKQKRFVYAEEADLLNVALFGMTAKEWRDQNPDLAENGNIRDYADLLQLIILNNLENINAQLIKNGLPQSERIAQLNEAARSQIRLLLGSKSFGEALCLKP